MFIPLGSRGTAMCCWNLTHLLNGHESCVIIFVASKRCAPAFDRVSDEDDRAVMIDTLEGLYKTL